MYTIRNIETQTLEKRYGDKCIAILVAEEEALRAISQATHISLSDSSRLKELTRRYTMAAIQSEIKLSYQGMVKYQCNWFGMETNIPLNLSVMKLIESSNALSSVDKQELLRKLRR